MPFKIGRKAYTLVELLVVLVIFLVEGTILFYLLIKALRWTSITAGSVKQQLSVDVNTDLLVFDLKHAGYGISRDESKLVIEYYATNKTLYVRSTLNPFKPSQPVGFQICNGTTLILASEFDSSWPYCIWFDLNRLPLNDGNPTGCNCSDNSSSDFAIAYAVDNTTSCKGSSIWCCNSSNCTTKQWFLNTNTSSSSFPKQCLNETKVLSVELKAYTRPIINCVSDWNIWFAIDEDLDGTTDLWLNEIPYTDIVETNADLQNKLKLIKIYMLVQTSYVPDSKFDFCNAPGINCNSPHCSSDSIEVDTLKDSNGTVHYICLKHPSNPIWNHYHWKVIEINVSNFPNIP